MRRRIAVGLLLGAGLGSVGCGAIFNGSSQTTGIIILDVLFTGLIGVVVDAATGSWNGLSPESATVALSKINASVDGPEQIVVGLRQSGKGIVIDAPADVSVGVARQE